MRMKCRLLAIADLFFVANSSVSSFFFFNDTATTEIYTLSLHDALPISRRRPRFAPRGRRGAPSAGRAGASRSEEHTSELQSPCNLVCRLLLEKKKTPSFPRVARDILAARRAGPASASPGGSAPVLARRA